MKQYLLIFAALLSINAHAQNSISNVVITANSIQFDMHLVPEITEDIYDELDYLIFWNLYDSDLVIDQSNLIYATTVNFSGIPSITRVFVGPSFIYDYFGISFDSDLTEGVPVSGSFYAEWDQAVFHPDTLYEITIEWGDDTGAGNPLHTFSNIPNGVTLTTALSGGNIQITVPTETGKNYQLQNSSTLTNWTNLGSAISGNGTTNTFTDATDQNAEFYRVEITDNP